MNREQPLEHVSSIKTKLAVLVGVSVMATALLALIGDRAGTPVWITVPVALGAALALTYWLARGMTAPLREMTAAASAMAGGDYSRPVTTTSTDEVGVLARAFTTMSRDLAATDQQRRELISTVSHELRTPLAAQRAVLENLVDGVTPPSARTLTAALSQTERLSDLVEDLLDLSRLESGTTRLDLTDIDLATLLEEAAREATLADRDVSVTVSVESGMRVRADRPRLTQILANLLDNATRHSPQGGTVTVAAALEPASAGSRWQLDVRDAGPGIEGPVADRLFERFSTGGEHAGGTGLGLAIARWIATIHGGTIALVPSTTGAHIRVILPVDPHPTPATPPTPTFIPPEPPREPAMTQPQASSSATAPRSASSGVVATSAQALGAGTTPPPPSLGGSIFSGLWPERDSRPQPLLLFGSLAVGALAALLAVERDIGLIGFVVLLLGGAVVWRASAERRSPLVLVSAALAVLLGIATVLRAAEWLAVLSVLLGGIVAAMAVTRATKVSGIVAAVASWPLSGIRGLPLLGRTITATSKRGTVWPVLRTVAFSLVALVLFGGLFASADAIFGSWAGAIVPDLRWDSIIARVFVLVMVSGITLAGSYLALNPPKVDDVLQPARRSVRLWEWAVPVGVVIAMFVGFLLAQGSATIRGHDYVQAQAGMSYADYVHQGFAQLTFATLLMLVVVALTLRKASRATHTDRLWVRILLGTLSVLTLAVVVSALWRMHLYQQAYGFTAMRLFVDGFELWLGIIVLFVLAALVRLSTRWLGRAAVLTAAVLMVVLTAMNPDAWVARHNIERFAVSDRLDAAYLATLSDDAVPTIASSALPEELKACVLHVNPHVHPMSLATPAQEDDWLELNVGRRQAVAARATVAPPSEPAVCEKYFAEDVQYGSSR